MTTIAFRVRQHRRHFKPDAQSKISGLITSFEEEVMLHAPFQRLLRRVARVLRYCWALAPHSLNLPSYCRMVISFLAPYTRKIPI